MTGTRKGRSVTCTICGTTGHQSTICPYRGPGVVNLHDIVKAEYQGKVPGYAGFWAYDVLAKERRLGIDSWAKRGLKRPGTDVRVPVKLSSVPGAVSIFPPTPEEPADVIANHKRAILEALDAAPKGEARTLGRLMEGIKRTGFWSDPHNIAHVVWALQKEGYVRFTERKGHNGSTLEHIAIRPAGLQRLAEMRGISTPEWPQASTKVHPVGHDGTDWRTHGRVAEGGPIERLTVEIEPIRLETQMKEPFDKPTVGEQIVEAATKWVEEKFELSKEEQVARDTETPMADEFPLISALARRHAKLEAAARLLEDAGLEDMAIAVMDRDTYTDFEKEVLRLWETRSSTSRA